MKKRDLNILASIAGTLSLHVRKVKAKKGAGSYARRSKHKNNKNSW